MAKGAKVLSSRRIMEGVVIKLDVDEIQEPHTDGPSQREVVRANPASAVVPVTSDGRIVLVRQYRYAVDEYLWEIPAGKCDEGENAAECAIRELAEETGYRTGSVRLLTRLRTTPGFSDEVIDVFRADGLNAGEPDPDPGESFELGEFTVDQIETMIRGGEITDAKTIAGVMLVKSDLELTER